MLETYGGSRVELAREHPGITWLYTWQLSCESFFGLAIGVAMLPYVPIAAIRLRFVSNLGLPWRTESVSKADDICNLRVAAPDA
jgi:hypothetical protein